MHLKSLTLKGFKSFASTTTLHFEPGITCVVGPNGSGKSNVVDALAWVMGEQGAKSLRGGSMQDVIFAGTAGRAPLGRAEVSLTIDNTDGALPIDYTEVTVTRTMFRNGGSEYAINGETCRLLDVQDLLSDSGIGREMHVIVGQGQLDAVLSATPEDRRGFVEEAAGVLKHRKRKEKALRKLDAMEANLTRLQDLTAELRRQLKPLGRQAEVARRAATVQASARDARARLLADDLAQLTAAYEAEVADDTAVRARRAQVEGDLAAAQGELAAVEAARAAHAPRLADCQDVWYRLAAVRDRLRGTADLAAERLRQSTAADEEPRPGRDPDELDQAAAAARAEEAALAAEQDGHRSRLAAAEQRRHRAEADLAEEERRLAVAAQAAADRREGLARLDGQVAARRSRVEAGLAEAGRLRDAAAEAGRRAAQAQAEFAALETQVAGLDAGEEDLDAAHDAAAADLAALDARLAALRADQQEAERERAAAAARHDALELGLRRRDGADALIGAASQITDADGRPGVLGGLAGLLEVPPAARPGVAAALGALADAVAVRGPDAARAALHLLRERDAGRASLVVARPGLDDSAPLRVPAPDDWPALPDGAVWAIEQVTAPPALADALAQALHRVALVDDLDHARRVLDTVPGGLAVTAHGDVLGQLTAAGGSAQAPSRLELQAAADEAAAARSAAEHRVERVRFAVAAAEQQRLVAAEAVAAALERLHESDARLAAVAETLGHHGAAARAARAEAERLGRARTSVEERLAADRAALTDLESRLAAAAAQPDIAAPSPQHREQLAARCVQARAEETDARLALRTVEERARALGGRAEALARAAATERAARARWAARQRRRAEEAAGARAVLAVAEQVLHRLTGSLEAAATERAAAEADGRALHEREAVARERVAALAGELEALVDSAHREEIARAEQRLRLDTLRQRARDELGTDPTVLVEEYGPHQPVPDLPGAAEPVPGDGEEPDGAAPATRPYVRAEQEKRLRTAERDLAALGRVNPLALEEFAAMEERHAFLVEQLEDLRATRRDLLDIVREVDERVEQVFTAAYHDTAREFEQVFARLFPGGQGRLVLTDPDDMLRTGIDVEARPPGKKVKRLSLLSGGERSLTAVALLVALFKARPSPFYVLDEVEAALDDTNLGRLLVLLAELRGSSQLLVVTHQKRTMEIADALYGVSMRGDGVSTVIGQRLREARPA